MLVRDKTAGQTEVMEGRMEKKKNKEGKQKKGENEMQSIKNSTGRYECGDNLSEIRDVVQSVTDLPRHVTRDTLAMSADTGREHVTNTPRCLHAPVTGQRDDDISNHAAC